MHCLWLLQQKYFILALKRCLQVSLSHICGMPFWFGEHSADSKEAEISRKCFF